MSRNTHDHCNHATGEIIKKPDFKMVYHGARSFKKNTETPFLNIPCGHCSECVAVKQQAFVQRVHMETKYNHVFFATLTYDNKHLPTTEVFIPKDCRKAAPVQEKPLTLFLEDGSPNESAIAEILERNEQRFRDFERDQALPFDKLPETDVWSSDEPEGHVEIIPYADIHHLQLMFKRLRDNNSLGRPFRYIAVTERGKKRARPHAHVMFFVPKYEGDSYPTCLDLEQKLRDMLLQYWVDVVTVKVPVELISNPTFTEGKIPFVNGILASTDICRPVLK